MVHVIGGGMAGLSVAHELVKFDQAVHGVSFEVHVHDREARWGGKSESQFVDHEGGRLPGEHGFRYFPHFYRCIVRTLGEIPFTPAQAEAIGWQPSPDDTVRGLLRDARQGALAFRGRLLVMERADRPSVSATMDMQQKSGMTRDDSLRYGQQMVRFITSSEARRLREYEPRTLAEVFDLGGDTYSEGFQAFVRSLRGLSAMRSDVGSARSSLHGSVQLWYNFDREANPGIDQVLPGPTDLLLIDPWVDHLQERGVQFHPRHELTAVHLSEHAFEQVVLDTPEGEVRIRGGDDETVVVLAVPMEALHPLVAAEGAPGPILERFRSMELDRSVEPMTGLQYFLRRDVPMCHGHVHYADTPWALTSVSQAQFWTEAMADGSLAERFGVPGLEGILSVIISAWDVPGTQVHRKPARECTPDEILEETWAQMQHALRHSDVALRDDDVLARHLDRRMVFGSGPARSQTPLFVSPAGTFLDRPTADLGLPDLFLASDYVRQETDLASMEGANEAARWAVRALLDEVAPGVDPAHYPAIPPLRMWGFAEAAQELDEVLFELGLPHLLDIGPLGWARALRSLPRRAARELREAVEATGASLSAPAARRAALDTGRRWARVAATALRMAPSALRLSYQPRHLDRFLERARQATSDRAAGPGGGGGPRQARQRRRP